MKIQFSEDGKEHLITEPEMTELIVESGLNPSEQIDYVESNPDAEMVDYAILFDDNWNVEKMFVRNLRFPDE